MSGDGDSLVRPKPVSPGPVSPDRLAAEFMGAAELAVIDVRTAREFGAGHIVGSINLDLGRLIRLAPGLLPRHETPVVLVDDGDGELAKLGQAALRELGYRCAELLDGGLAGWRRSGRAVHAGAALEMKAFGGWVLREFATPRISVAELRRLRAQSTEVLLLDVRTSQEFGRATLPGALHVPLGEVAAWAETLAGSPQQTVVLTCTSLTRGVLAAQTLIDIGLPNPVFALHGGAMSWVVAGEPVVAGGDKPAAGDVAGLGLVPSAGRIPASDSVAELAELSAGRSLWAFDVRPDAPRVPGLVRASGGELVHSREDHFGAIGGVVALLDSENLSRASSMARWLALYGVADPVVIHPGEAEQLAELVRARQPSPEQLDLPPTVGSAPLDPRRLLLDLSASTTYRRQHPRGAQWASANRLLVEDLPSTPLLLTSEEGSGARLAAAALRSRGADVTHVPGGNRSLRAAGVSFSHGGRYRHSVDDLPPAIFQEGKGDPAQIADYLEWEAGLVTAIAAEPAIAFGTRTAQDWAQPTTGRNPGPATG